MSDDVMLPSGGKKRAKEEGEEGRTRSINIPSCSSSIEGKAKTKKKKKEKK